MLQDHIPKEHQTDHEAGKRQINLFRTMTWRTLGVQQVNEINHGGGPYPGRLGHWFFTKEEEPAPTPLVLVLSELPPIVVLMVLHKEASEALLLTLLLLMKLIGQSCWETPLLLVSVLAMLDEYGLTKPCSYRDTISLSPLPIWWYKCGGWIGPIGRWTLKPDRRPKLEERKVSLPAKFREWSKGCDHELSECIAAKEDKYPPLW